MSHHDARLSYGHSMMKSACRTYVVPFVMQKQDWHPPNWSSRPHGTASTLLWRSSSQRISNVACLSQSLFVSDIDAHTHIDIDMDIAIDIVISTDMDVDIEFDTDITMDIDFAHELYT